MAVPLKLESSRPVLVNISSAYIVYKKAQGPTEGNMY